MSYESVSDEGANPNEELTVVADDRTFAPASLTIDSGSTTTIALQNPSDETHTLTLYLESEPSGVVVADTGEVAAGTTGQAVVLLTSGEHAFRCEIHPDVMRGTISVR